MEKIYCNAVEFLVSQFNSTQYLIINQCVILSSKRTKIWAGPRWLKATQIVAKNTRFFLVVRGCYASSLILFKDYCADAYPNDKAR